MALHHPAVGRPVLVIGCGQEGLNLLDICLLHTSQFPDLHNPEALELFCSGYIMKPLSSAKIWEQAAHLRYPVPGLTVHEDE